MLETSRSGPAGRHATRIAETAFLQVGERSRCTRCLAPQGEPRDYVVSVDRVQHLSGLDFFAALPDSEEHRLEAVVSSNWPIR